MMFLMGHPGWPLENKRKQGNHSGDVAVSQVRRGARLDPPGAAQVKGVIRVGGMLWRSRWRAVLPVGCRGERAQVWDAQAGVWQTPPPLQEADFGLGPFTFEMPQRTFASGC